MALRRVWVESWQMQCCGAPFSVGSTVTWTTQPVVGGDEWLSSFLGEDEARRFTDTQEHHGPQVGELGELVGVVRSIEAVYCRYEIEGGTQVGRPLAGSGARWERVSADGWEPEDPSDAASSFAGYAVDVAT